MVVVVVAAAAAAAAVVVVVVAFVVVVVVRVAVVVVAVVTVRSLARQGRAGTRREDWPSPIFFTNWPWLAAPRGSREGLELVKKIGLAQFC